MALKTIRFVNSRAPTPEEMEMIERVANAVRAAGFKPVPPKIAEKIKRRRMQVESIRDFRKHRVVIFDDEAGKIVSESVE